MARLWDVSVEDIEEFQSCGCVQNVSYGDQRVLSVTRAVIWIQKHHQRVQRRGGSS